MRSMVRYAWEAGCQELSAIIYGSYLRTKLKPTFGRPRWERVSAYLFHKNEFNKGRNIVLYPAFFPSLKHNNKSVYWTTKLMDHFIWSIAARHIVPKRGPTKGRANLSSAFIYAAPRLSVDLNSKPHPRHANVVGWPTDRKQVRLYAEKLADNATLVLAPVVLTVSAADVTQDRLRERVSSVVLSVLLLLAGLLLLIGLLTF